MVSQKFIQLLHDAKISRSLSRSSATISVGEGSFSPSGRFGLRAISYPRRKSWVA